MPDMVHLCVGTHFALHIFQNRDSCVASRELFVALTNSSIDPARVPAAPPDPAAHAGARESL